MTAPTITALAVSAAALILAGLSLTWQIIVWKRSGPLIEVDVEATTYIDGDEPSDLFTVYVTNAGRASTELRRWWLKELTDGLIWAGFEVRKHDTAELPRTLEAGHTAVFHVDRTVMTAEARRRGQETLRLQGGGEWGGRQTAVSKELTFDVRDEPGRRS